MLSRAKNCCIVTIKDDVDETRELCRTLDIDVIEVVCQKRRAADPNTFIGSGKVEELKDWTSKVDLFVFDGELKPSQHFRLETTLKKMCVDRIGLVLEIFDRHAGSSEAKAQIALARIRYELPFLREWASKSISGDRPGFMAGGEYVIDAYYENARKQMKRIEQDLQRITKEREARRSRRRDRGFYLVAICGYTNVGKSTLLNALSGAETKVDDKMFSTLSTTTRRLTKSRKRILVTDTVGFIKNLPPNLIDAFDATLEEIYLSDCAVLVLDLSDDLRIIEEKLKTSLKILVPHIEKSKIIIVLNKADKLSLEDTQNKLNLLYDDLFGFIYYVMSAERQLGMEELVNGILDRIGITEEIELIFSDDDEGRKLYHWISERFVIAKSEWIERVHLRLRVTPDEKSMIENKVASQARAELQTVEQGSKGN